MRKPYSPPKRAEKDLVDFSPAFRSMEERERPWSSLSEDSVAAMLNALGYAGLFQRQYPIGPYFADFCIESKRLVFELDGPCHLASQQKVDKDRARTAFIARRGFRIVRLSIKLSRRGNQDQLKRLLRAEAGTP